VIKINAGNMNTFHKSCGTTNGLTNTPNKSTSGIMPDNGHFDPVCGGGERHSWMHPRFIGYNHWSNKYKWSGDPDLLIIEHGNDQGVAGWHQYQIHGSGCTPVYTKNYDIGTTNKPVKYYETTLLYGCTNLNTDLIDDCACPITVSGKVKHQVNMTATSQSRGGCMMQSSKFEGKLEEMSNAILIKQNLRKKDVTLTAIDAGQANTYTNSSFTVNNQFYYDLIGFVKTTVQATATAIATGGSSLLIDTNLTKAIRMGIDLAATKPAYATSVNNSNTLNLVDKDFFFELYPNERATVQLNNISHYELYGDNYGNAHLTSVRNFLVALYSDAYEDNICCNPAFMTCAQVGFGADKNYIFNQINQGNNNKGIDYSADNQSMYWGEEDFDFTCSRIRIVYKRTDNNKKDLSPNINFINREIEFKNLPKGKYQFTITNLLGQNIFVKSIDIEELNGTIQFDYLPKGFIIFNLKNDSVNLSKKVNYEY
jgi:hypothetical protein